METHYFDIEKYKVCPLRNLRNKEGAKSKTSSVSLKSEAQAEQFAFQQTKDFIRLVKEPYKVEAKKSSNRICL